MVIGLRLEIDQPRGLPALLGARCAKRRASSGKPSKQPQLPSVTYDDADGDINHIFGLKLSSEFDAAIPLNY